MLVNLGVTALPVLKDWSFMYKYEKDGVRFQVLLCEKCKVVILIFQISHCVQSVHIPSYSAPYFPHSDWIQRDTEYLSGFSPNAGKYGPEKLRIRTLFTQWVKHILMIHCATVYIGKCEGL